MNTCIINNSLAITFALLFSLSSTALAGQVKLRDNYLQSVLQLQSFVKINELVEASSIDSHSTLYLASNDVKDAPQRSKKEPSLIPEDIKRLSQQYNSNQKEVSTDDMFGIRGGYIHPYLSIRGEYTDNIYNIKVDERENLLTVISPGIWIGIPRIKELPVTLSPHNAAVGGTRYSTVGSGSFERYQTYLLFGLDHKIHSENADLDNTAWRIEGLYQQNLPAGISIRFMDRFTRDRDRYDLGSFKVEDFSVNQGDMHVSSTPSKIRDYYTNQAVIGINLDISKRFSLLLDYTNFWLQYDSNFDEWLDRTDNNISLAFAYNHSSKTSIFVQYSHTLLEYGHDTSNDSEVIDLHLGLNWRSTAKTSLMLKGGYQTKIYSNIDEELIDEDSQNNISFEGIFNYLITDKTKIALKGYKSYEETDNLQNRGKDTIAAKFRYDQRFTYRFHGYAEVWYEINDYEGFYRTELGELNRDPRKDKRYLLRPGVQYFFRDWLIGELAYSYEKRKSNEDNYDFDTQTLFLSLNLAF